MQTKKISFAGVALPMGLAGIFVAAFMLALNVARAEYGSSAGKSFAMSVNQSSPTPTATPSSAVSPSPSATPTPTPTTSRGCIGNSNETLPVLCLSLDSSTPLSRTLMRGEKNVVFAKVKMTAAGKDTNLINMIQLGTRTSDANSKLTNFRILKDGSAFGSTGQSLVSNGDYNYYWSFLDTKFSVSANGSVVISIVADVKADATSGNVNLGLFGINFDFPGGVIPEYPYTKIGNDMVIGALVSPSPSPIVSPSTSPSPTASASPSPSPKQTVTERFYADPDKDEYGTPNDYITVEQNSALPAGYMRWITGRDNDNCPTVYNPDQKDTDKDGKGDVCDTNVTPTPTASPSPTPTPITTVVPPVAVVAKVFLRGDANQDNRVDQSDSIMIRDYLNIGGRLSCLDAADANDDGFVTMNDVNYLQSWLFLGTATEPPKPGAFAKGVDPTPDDMGCGEKEGSPTGAGGTYTDNLMFLRGDANSDGVIDVSDSTRIANHIQGSGRVRCSDAADANDDGFVNNQDYEYIVNYLFHGGPAPSSPTPSRGYGGDLTPDSIGCMDNSPAILRNVSVTGITKTSAVVQWDTEKDSDSHVLYGTTLVNGAISGGAETGSADPLLRNHTVVLQDLRSGTKYNIQAISSHDRGYTRGTSEIIAFTTLSTRGTPVASPTPIPSPRPNASPTPKPSVSPRNVGDLVKKSGESAVYFVDEGNVLRPFINEKAFYGNGYNSFNSVRVLNTLEGYTVGSYITAPAVSSPTPSGTPASSPTPSSSPTVVSSPVATPSPLPSPTLSFPNQVLPQAVIFLRGDANTDGAVDISDAIVISEYINAAKPIVCKDAADYNDDGVITMADVALLQSWLFLGGDPPKAPYPARGADFTSDKLNCLQYNK